MITQPTSEIEREAERIQALAQTEIPKTTKAWNRYAVHVAYVAAAETIRLKAELEKWKDGCLVNADNLKDSLWVQDQQRLEIIALKTQLEQLREENARLREALTTAMESFAREALNQKAAP